MTNNPEEGDDREHAEREESLWSIDARARQNNKGKITQTRNVRARASEFGGDDDSLIGDLIEMEGVDEIYDRFMVSYNEFVEQAEKLREHLAEQMKLLERDQKILEDERDRKIRNTIHLRDLTAVAKDSAGIYYNAQTLAVLNSTGQEEARQLDGAMPGKVTSAESLWGIGKKIDLNAVKLGEYLLMIRRTEALEREAQEQRERIEKERRNGTLTKQVAEQYSSKLDSIGMAYTAVKTQSAKIDGSLYHASVSAAASLLDDDEGSSPDVPSRDTSAAKTDGNGILAELRVKRVFAPVAAGLVAGLRPTAVEGSRANDFDLVTTTTPRTSG